jgi:hypothetical protein
MPQLQAERPTAGPALSPDAARTRRQIAALGRGVHPITAGPLHPDAPDDATPKDRFPREGTCGTCAFLVYLDDATPKHPNRRTLKCNWANGARITRGPASDVRRWWPGCAQYTPVVIAT